MTSRPVRTTLAALLLLTASGPASAGLCDFADIAVFAFDSIDFKKSADVIGDVVANGDGSVVALDRDSTVTGDVAGGHGAAALGWFERPTPFVMKA